MSRHINPIRLAILFLMPLFVSGCGAILIGRELIRDDSTSAPALEFEGITRITDDEYLYEHPKWAPDGRTIAVSRNMEGQDITGPPLTEWEAVLLDTATYRVEPVLEDSAVAARSPDWSTISGELMLVEYDGTINKIAIRETNQGTRRTIECATCDFPVWSSSGDTIVTGAMIKVDPESPSEYGIYVLDSENGERLGDVVLGDPFLGHFTLAPSSESILIADYECTGIWKVELDTGLITTFVDDKVLRECDPTYSFDGSKIAYTVRSIEDKYSSIVIANADGSSPKELLRIDGFGIYYPNWSPDGSRIAFVYGLIQVTAPSYSTLYTIDVPPALRP